MALNITHKHVNLKGSAFVLNTHTEFQAPMSSDHLPFPTARLLGTLNFMCLEWIEKGHLCYLPVRSLPPGVRVTKRTAKFHHCAFASDLDKECRGFLLKETVTLACGTWSDLLKTGIECWPAEGSTYVVSYPKFSPTAAHFMSPEQMWNYSPQKKWVEHQSVWRVVLIWCRETALGIRIHSDY